MIPAPPTFEEITRVAVVTFRVNVLGPGREALQVGTGAQPESELESQLESQPETLHHRSLPAETPRSLEFPFEDMIRKRNLVASR